MVHTAVRAIILHDGKILLMKRNKFGAEYYTLLGGGINIGEDPETALRRELQEEASITVGAVRVAYREDAGIPYGVQYVYVYEYIGGDPKLSAESEEAIINQSGHNTYQPVWVSLEQFSAIPLRSESLKQAILQALTNGFPETAVELAWQPEDMSSLDGKDVRST